MSKRYTLLLLICFICIMSVPAYAEWDMGGAATGGAAISIPGLTSFVGHTEDDLVEVYDEDGNYIFSSCLGIFEGDRYINEDNQEYEVIRVDEDRAICKSLGTVDLLAGEKLLGSVLDLPPLVQKGEDKNKEIGMYHTHSAESYKPGPAFKTPRGQIYQVGDVLKKELEKKGVKVLQSDETFLPHDGGAYERSRPICADLVKKQPDAIFDVHRDAIPRASEYLSKVKGEEISQVRLVVGRQNPKREPNEQMAKRLKAIADEKYPGLIKGIFYAKGKYNQELSSRCLLLEMGTHVTTDAQAKASASMLADSITTMLYGAGGTTGGGEAGTKRAQSNAGWKNVIWIVLAVVVGGAAFLFLNEGGLSGVSGRLKEFTGEEFANVLGRKKSRENSSKNHSIERSTKSSRQKKK